MLVNNKKIISIKLGWTFIMPCSTSSECNTSYNRTLNPRKDVYGVQDTECWTINMIALDVGCVCGPRSGSRMCMVRVIDVEAVSTGKMFATVLLLHVCTVSISYTHFVSLCACVHMRNWYTVGLNEGSAHRIHMVRNNYMCRYLLGFNNRMICAPRLMTILYVENFEWFEI